MPMSSKQLKTTPDQPANPQPATDETTPDQPADEQPANPQDQQTQPGTHSEPGEIGIPAQPTP